MQKNWYIVYTKPKCEKKVDYFLKKKEMETFFPLNSKVMLRTKRQKILYEPLFPNYVFIKTTENEISALLQYENIISLVYWKCKLAIIPDQEIEAIKSFSSWYQGIRIEKMQIIKTEPTNYCNTSNYILDGQVLVIKNTSRKLDLPSLGMTMIGDKKDSFISLQTTVTTNDLTLQ